MVMIVNKEPSALVVKEVVCRNCGVTLQYTPRDVTEKSYQDYGGGFDTHSTILCPNCGTKVSV